MPRSRHLAPRRLVGVVLGLALLVAMVLNTTFATPEELATAGPQEFDPAATAEELFADARKSLAAEAAPLGDVVTAIQSDLPAAAGDFGAIQPNATTFIFAVTATGTVTEANDGSIRLAVDGVPAPTPVTVPTTTGINGTVLRDALGFSFADAPGQSAFQVVGDELKALMQAALQSDSGGAALAPGMIVDVVGVLSVTDTGGAQPPQKPVAVQPISMQMSS